MASTTRWATKTSAPSMVYIAGEEMTNYACELITKDWIGEDGSKFYILHLSAP